MGNKRKNSSSTARANAIIGQSGGPTAVINQSLVGVIEALQAFEGVKKIYGMRHGVNGLVKENVVDLTKAKPKLLKAVAQTPSAALGSSRDKPDRDYCNSILNAASKLGVRYFFYIGGNDSSDTCRIVSELAAESGYDLRCFHVPKTVDNDLMNNDHTPGYPSAARFVATAFRADNLDNRSLPGIKINVVMGRHAGFLTAASALARHDENDGPHLIYLPEVPFDTDRFIQDVEGTFTRLGRCQIAVSEGIVDRDGKPIISSLLTTGDTDQHGNVQLSGTGALGDALAELVKKRLRTSAGKPPRVRADTFGYLQRCWPDASKIDAKEARGAGKFAVKLAMKGEKSGSVAIVRESDKPYTSSFRRIELSDVAAKTRHMPAEYIAGTNNVTPAFIRYAAPLVGELPEMCVI